MERASALASDEAALSDDPSVRFQKSRAAGKTLKYTVELLAADGTVERLLARAHSQALARAVFQASKEEFPGRAIVLREGGRILARTDRPS